RSAWPRALPAQHELAEKTHTNAGGTLHPCRVLTFGIRGARDVEVRPGKAVDELAQKPPRGDAAGGPAPGVLHVGDIRLHEVAVLVPERQRPDPLARALAGGTHVFDQ